VVLLVALLLAFGLRSLGGQVQDESSTLHTVTGMVGASVSGSFLVLLGILNLTVLVGLVRVVRRIRAGELDEQAL
jgi:high-affinity nickel-transport protein